MLGKIGFIGFVVLLGCIVAVLTLIGWVQGYAWCHRKDIQAR